MNNKKLSYWLSKFVCEVRKTNGDEYPPKSVFSLCMGIQGYLRMEKKCRLDLLRDPHLELFRQVLDGRMKALVRNGLGNSRKQAEVFTPEQENMFWKKGLLGDKTPKVLLRTILFLNGKHFALRSGNEHRALRYANSQIKLYEGGPREYLEYTEDYSKCNQGGLSHLRVKPKIARSYAIDDDKCHVRLYKEYMRRCPKFGRDNTFYLTPLQRYHSDLWYSKQPAGHNTLQKMIPQLCVEGGIAGHYTNHSLRVTAATTLYRAGVEEQLIMEKQGTGVRSYKRTDDEMKEAVSDILNSKRPRLEDYGRTWSQSATVTSSAFQTEKEYILKSPFPMVEV